MNPLIWLSSAILLIATILMRRFVRQILQRRKFVALVDKLPGPPALPLLGSALMFSPDNEKSTYQMEYLFRYYTFGDAGMMRLWIGPKVIVFLMNPEAVKAVLESNVLISKPFEYSFLQGWLGTGLITSTGEKWKRRRKLLTPAFHFKILANFTQVFNRQCNVLVQELDKCAQHGYPFDFFRMIKIYTLDIICEAAMGIRLNALEGNNASYVEALKKVCELSFNRIRSPWLWPTPIWWLSGKGGIFARNMNIITELTQEVVENRKRERAIKQSTPEQQQNGTSNNSTCFLDLLLELQEQNELSDEDIRDEVQTFMSAGHDTVSSSLGFMVFSLGHRPALQERLHTELCEIFGDELDRDVTNEDLAQMRYGEQCIRETMRLLPTVPIIGRVITTDTEICGYKIPVGVTVMVSTFSIHRDKRYYHSPDHFDPDHFSPENVLRRNKEPYAYLPFSAGPRNCIGQKFATTEQKVTVAKIFRRFRVISMQNEVESRGLPELTLKPSNGFWIRVERR